MKIWEMAARVRGFPGDLNSKESACSAGDLDSIPGLGRSPGGGHGNTLQDSGLENPRGQRTLAGYHPWGHRELDTTEQLSTAHTYSFESYCKILAMFPVPCNISL